MQNFGNIDKFLEKFNSIILLNETVRRSLLEIIKDETEIDLDIKDISVKNNTAYIKCSSIIKSEIFLNKKKILNRLETMNGRDKIIDIR